MALHKDKYSRPPNPDANLFVWVDTKEGGYYRKKRGSVKKAGVNDAFHQSGSLMKVTAPAASRIVRKLQPYMKGIDAGRITSRISGLLRKDMQLTQKLSLHCLKDLDFQPDNPMKNLLQVDVTTEITRNELVVTLPIKPHTIKRLNTLVTAFYFELVLLYGDATKDNGLRTESADSMVYNMEKDYRKNCVLSLVLPGQHWLALLKINSFEGKQMANHPKMYGMMVVASGE